MVTNISDNGISTTVSSVSIRICLDALLENGALRFFTDALHNSNKSPAFGNRYSKFHSQESFKETLRQKIIQVLA